jgi:drug/metabolite transporter (DMT)-like permease
MTGVGLLVLGDYHFAPENVAGDLICFGSMLLYAAYLTFGRRHRGFPTIWHYVVPLYGMAGLLCLGAGLIFERPAVPRLSGEGILASSDGSIWLGLLAVLGLAVVPTVGGHSIINFSMKHLRGQLVGLINLFQFVFAGVMASFVFGELPPPAFFLACFLVISGAGLVILADRRAARPVEKPAAQANRTE